MPKVLTSAASTVGEMADSSAASKVLMKAVGKDVLMVDAMVDWKAEMLGWNMVGLKAVYSIVLLVGLKVVHWVVKTETVLVGMMVLISVVTRAGLMVGVKVALKASAKA